jgi:hypothetical protein
MSSQTEFDNIKVLLIGQNKNINVAPFPIEENKINIKKDEVEPFFDAECIFSMKEMCTIPLIGRFITSRRKRQPCVIYLYGKQHCEKLKAPIEDQQPSVAVDPQNPSQEKPEDKDKTIGNLFEPLTNKERVEIVKREISKALRKFQPFSNTIVIILILLLVANLILTLMGLKGMRI